MADKGEKLLPCPFCGNTNPFLEGDPNSRHVTCNNDLCQCSIMPEATDAKAIAAWNNRPSTSTGESDWVLVPREPAVNMRHVGGEVVEERQGHSTPRDLAAAVYREMVMAASLHTPRAMLASAPAPDTKQEPVAWACVKCNSPRSVDPCPKCGTALTKPADGWDWPTLPDIDHIRALAREVGYAVGVHGSLERDLDLIAAPWVADAVGPMALAEHIAVGLGGRVVDFERQDKPCGRWSCNIHTPDWTKMIDLSVMPPVPSPVTQKVSEAMVEAACVELVRHDKNWAQSHWPSEEPHEVHYQSGYRRMSSPVWGEHLETIRTRARAALTAALQAQEKSE